MENKILLLFFPEKPKGVPDIRTMFGGKNGMKTNGNGNKSSNGNSVRSKTLINPGRPSSTPIESDSDKETASLQDRPVSAFDNATIVGGVLNRPKGSDEDAERPFARQPIATVFSPNENRKTNNKPNKQTWKVDNSVRPTVKPNIHTISSNGSKTDIQEFSGTGHILGGNLSNRNSAKSDDQNNSRAIVRRIPGIGVIRSERPSDRGDDRKDTRNLNPSDSGISNQADGETDRATSASLFTSDSEHDIGDVDLTLDLSTRLRNQISSEGEIEVLGEISSSRESTSPSLLKNEPKEEHKSGNGSHFSSFDITNSNVDNAKPSTSSDKVAGTKKLNTVNSNRKRIYMPYFSSDDDDSDILFKLGRSDDSNSPPSKRRNIDQKERHNYPSVCSKKSVQYKKSRIFGKKSSAPRNGDTSRAADRNRRGCDLGPNTDEETTDDEEGRRSGLKRYKKSNNNGSRNTTPFSDTLEISDSNSRSTSRNSGRSESVKSHSLFPHHSLVMFSK